VAYEMAQQLLVQGERTKLLALFETYNHNGVAPASSFENTVRVFTQKIAFHWGNVTRLPLRERFAYLGEKAKGARARELSRLSVKLAGGSKPFLESVN